MMVTLITTVKEDDKTFVHPNQDEDSLRVWITHAIEQTGGRWVDDTRAETKHLIYDIVK